MSALAIVDATEATFEQEVLERSRRMPVVVDFWAEWCGPCRQLSPILERVAARHADEVAMVKVDVDAAPTLSRTYRVQGIPAVKAFRDAAMVAEFTGVLPEARVDEFFASLLPSQADRLVAEAAGRASDEAEGLLREALADDPGHPAAVVALARLLAERGQKDEAVGLLGRVPHDAGAQQLLAELRIADEQMDGDALDRLRAEAGGGDADARLRLGRALAAAGEHEEALDVLLAAVREPSTRDEARSSVLEVFTLLGDDHDLVRRARPRLASALF